MPAARASMVCCLVPVVGGRDDDRVDRLVGEHRAPVAVVPRLAAEPLDGPGDRPLYASQTPITSTPGTASAASRTPDWTRAPTPMIPTWIRSLGETAWVTASASWPSTWVTSGRRRRAHQALLHELPAVDPWLHLVHLSSVVACTLRPGVAPGQECVPAVPRRRDRAAGVSACRKYRWKAVSGPTRRRASERGSRAFPSRTSRLYWPRMRCASAFSRRVTRRSSPGPAARHKARVFAATLPGSSGALGPAGRSS